MVEKNSSKQLHGYRFLKDIQMKRYKQKILKSYDQSYKYLFKIEKLWLFI